MVFEEEFKQVEKEIINTIFDKHLQEHFEVKNAIKFPGIPICKIYNKDSKQILKEEK